MNDSHYATLQAIDRYPLPEFKLCSKPTAHRHIAAAIDPRDTWTDRHPTVKEILMYTMQAETIMTGVQ